MKRMGTVCILLLFLASVALSFSAGTRISDNAHTQDRAQRCSRLISIAIETAENKGLSVEGAAEAIASNIWAAHELCDDPEISAQLSNLWNTLVFSGEVYVGQESTLSAQLKDILEKCP